jgi:hypothetical protein
MCGLDEGGALGGDAVKKKAAGKKELPFEKYFPNVQGRQAADKAIEALGLEEHMMTYIDTWEAAYHAVAKKSPWRGKKS